MLKGNNNALMQETLHVTADKSGDLLTFFNGISLWNSVFSLYLCNMDIDRDKNGNLYCCRCGSRSISIRAGMMVDRAICNNCGAEEYL